MKKEQMLIKEIIEKYNKLPKYKLLYIKHSKKEKFNADCLPFLSYKNKDNKIIFLDEKIYKDPLDQFELYVIKELNCILPDIKIVKEKEKKVILEYMFQEHDIKSFDWESLNPTPGYYLCYYRYIGKNKWIYNFDIFEIDEYGDFNNLSLKQCFDYKNIISFVFLEKL